MFSIVFPVIAPVLIVVAVGFGWARAGRPFDTATVSALGLGLGTPFLLTDVLMSANIAADALAAMGLAALLTLAGMAVGGALTLRLLKLPQAVFLPSMIFGNTGNIALPLCLFAFGDEGLALSIGYFTVVIVIQFSATALISSGERPVPVILRNPVIWTLLVVGTLKAGGIALPGWLADTAHMVGGMCIPVMLLALGVSLARLKVAGLGVALLLGAVKIALGVALGYATVLALDLHGAARGVVLIQSAMPPAVFNYLFAARYNQRPEEVAGLVIVSTGLSVLTMPLLLWGAMADM
ncbi:AEC family transporter [Rhodospirillum rubrum]|uniref:Auxin Efflux Carrier n=1 Tax=Rhodospirillum rubrum (strain ATCC 11170 / ATH 1.1.1 / DSM 467 / LMG 4362 / NCIMB 8255 / S1) TaxID=269796 RepID=Q2RXQ0_RHORT|nr:AEC family transporter [Rhodospirillum rubrum]ABC21095.1 Auxin Efflux Carrier [Rhodospirillum rubrum ATCC 11170]AEO46763.1 auxin efflux carrier [Rhodospirillum rubrum F11]MBK5952643.1 transporter [Rhodospirillum rubrum]QXG80787.1 AEC family transporter [Rhodospirillum rubrum]HAQ00798.1 transporter [Rhodospirillum rubrum]